MHSFGSKLKQLREEQGFSQEQLAKELNVSRQAVWKWETDKGLPDIQNIVRLSELFDVSTDYLLKESELIAEPTPSRKWDSEQDIGFYLGMILILIGALAFEGSASWIWISFGLAFLIFFDDLLISIKRFFSNRDN
ncbi:helix-turn-helix domain-containing protein [Shouchella clausii]|jgi:transcriptional regulator with XRE-family HTH domain|uniref:Transcriptional regulator n=1 Tax=Shouchella clausii TaxID=79880 RepID=A0A268NV76_SHOCL|nr:MULTISPECIES: helix-turn-helix domain-containing protein [Shouchella]MCM3311576.1 helix-turn-helix domain-containing protein [Psychrobacillus sp. MER TA 17]ALA51596.1 Transcriptional regulator [Shouchella clausii]KKI85541.1 DNA-binding protein [Shouchella clausii]MBU3232918.1 helix-turn-helix domain-containing protein [Shouchella clausii]MBU3264604.1 helix-turn-helix domain-containing protein [Shouchella clausii]